MEQQENRDMAAEAAQFRAEHPQVEQLTDQVSKAWADGTPLAEAWEQAQEAELQAQNQETAARAPVAGVTGSGSVQEPRKDDFLSGFEADTW